MKKSIIAMCLAVASICTHAQELVFIDGIKQNMTVAETSRFLEYKLVKKETGVGNYTTGSINFGASQLKCDALFDHVGLYYIDCEVIGNSQMVRRQFSNISLHLNHNYKMVASLVFDQYEFATAFKNQFIEYEIFKQGTDYFTDSWLMSPKTPYSEVEMMLVNSNPKEYRVSFKKLLRFPTKK